MKRLALSARSTAEWKGHQLIRFSEITPDDYRSICRVCGMGVWLNTNPLPNEIDIGGEAVALNCPGHTPLAN